MEARRTIIVILSVAGLLFFGGITTITQDDYLQTTTDQLPGHVGTLVTFNYPWFGNFLMFLAMALVGIGWAVEAARDRKARPKPKTQAGTGTETPLETSTQILDVAEETTDATRAFAEAQRAEGRDTGAGPCKRCWNRFMRTPWGVLIFTAVFDLVASGLGSIGLSPQCNVPPSVYQMLQVSVIIFTALFSFCFLKRRLSRAQVLGIGVCFGGLCLVALSSYLADRFYPEEAENANTTRALESLTTLSVVPFARSVAIRPVGVRRTRLERFLAALDGEKPNLYAVEYELIGAREQAVFVERHPSFLARLRAADSNSSSSPAPESAAASTGMLFLGIGLIVLGQLIYAAQFTVEDYTLSRIDAYPTQVVCIEGIYGLLMTVCVTMPVLWAMKVEDDYEAFRFIGVCPKILVPIGVFFVCVAFYNGFGQTITKNISANHRTIIEGLRGLVVWIFALIERAIFGPPWGESLRSWASLVQAVGFAVQLVGSLIFYGLIPVRCLKEKESARAAPTAPADV